ncbi:hypothetical protein AOL_s00169g247 [Orbilia oligospora ATCC 24927]|uniref:CBM1 domain-containing protein n=2 Tax=Orbilia oligospora TaxID=2813651 RepID=G1XN44_ARTOA|nr:hypothetical protein AOL_s00169g247 [Orbilia oligospora ATCC 24927]EGX45641.1 hypothetical protein AOL_s00169g247 [Orbilia oligospora ATCC 24927]KAF3283363.1 hypothetical protein TWF970_001343 [Orbilia oligospora]
MDSYRKIIAAGAVLSLLLLKGANAQAQPYAQCGGSGYTGPTTCVSGWTCVYSSEWYSQCLQGTAAISSTAATTTRTTTSAATTSRTTTTSSKTTLSTTIRTTTTSASPGATGCVIYVSTSGSDSNNGSINSPFAGIQKAVDTATPGCTIYIRSGTYKPLKNIQIAKSGTSSQRYTISAYPGEKVIIDGDNMTGTPADLNASLANSDRGIFHVQNANYWTFKKLELINGPYGMYNRDASYNDFLDLITRDNYESGFQLEGEVAYCNVINLDSYGNRDPRKNGESADGLAIKQGRGAGNVVRGARLWNNVDDGMDLWMFETPILIENTIAWGNGVNRWGFSPFEGDGNGFKLGGGDPDVPANHIIRNCYAFSNAKHGFTDNGNYGTLNLDHNTAWKNGGTGFSFANSPSKLTNNLASNNAATYTLKSGGSQSANSWNIGGTWNDARFISTTTALVTGARDSNNMIPASDFLLLKDGTTTGATTHV